MNEEISAAECDRQERLEVVSLHDLDRHALRRVGEQSHVLAGANPLHQRQVLNLKTARLIELRIVGPGHQF